MKLTKISAVNLKGLSFEHELAPATFFVGANYLGKTARADAIKLALAGYLPELGKRNEATFGLCSSSTLAVIATLENNVSVSRSWMLRGNSIKGERELPPVFENREGILEVMLNADSWFGLTESQRIEWVYANAPVAVTQGRNDVVEQIKDAVQIAVNDPESKLEIEPDKRAALVDQTTDQILHIAFRAESNADEPFNPRQWLDAMFEAADFFTKEARRKAVQMAETVAGVASHRAADEAPVDLAEIEADGKRYAVELDNLRSARAIYDAAITVERNAESRRMTITRELTGKKEKEQELTRLKSNLQTLETELKEIPFVTADESKEQKMHYDESTSTSRSIQLGIGVREGQIKQAKLELSKLTHATSCPFCGAAGDGWKEILDTKYTGEIKKLETEIAELTSKKSAADYQAAAAKKSFDAKEAHRSNSLVIAHQIQTVKDLISQIELFLAQYAGKAEVLVSIPKADPLLPGKIEELNRQIGAKQNEIALNKDQYKYNVGRQNDLKRIAESEKARDAAKAEEIVGNEVKQSLSAIKAKAVEDAFEPLLVAANRFAGDLMKTPISFNPAKGEIGTHRNGVWIGHKTFTGVEKLVTYAAIQAAFASAAPVRVMILDEMLRAHGEVFDKLITACIAAVNNGLVDNFVGIIPGNAKDYAYLTKIEAGKEPCKVIEIV